MAAVSAGCPAAGGGHGIGVMRGPAIGEVVAELMAEGTLADPPPSGVRLARFEAGSATYEPISLKRRSPERRFPGLGTDGASGRG